LEELIGREGFRRGKEMDFELAYLPLEILGVKKNVGGSPVTGIATCQSSQSWSFGMKKVK